MKNLILYFIQINLCILISYYFFSFNLYLFIIFASALFFILESLKPIKSDENL